MRCSALYTVSKKALITLPCGPLFSPLALVPTYSYVMTTRSHYILEVYSLGWRDCSVGKVLVLQEEEPKLDPKNPHSKEGIVLGVCDPDTRKTERKVDPAGLAQLVSSRSVKGPVSPKQSVAGTGEMMNPEDVLQPPPTRTLMCTLPHTHVQTLTYKVLNSRSSRRP